jgi:signal transduction histidine kinase
MSTTPSHPCSQNRRCIRLAISIVVVLICLGTLPHYLAPQTPLLPYSMGSFLDRHAVERFVFVLPVIVATWALRWQGGVFTLVLTVMIMLPRAIWISPSPPDALFETAAAALIGSLSIWVIEAQARQGELCQTRAERLSALNTVSREITSRLELDEILDTVLEIAEKLVGADGGGIALFDSQGTSIHYPYLHNLPQELAQVSIPHDQGAAGEATRTGIPLLVENYQAYPQAVPAFVEAGLISVVSVPIVSGDRAFGALTLVSLKQEKHFAQEDIDLLTGISRQTAVAIENARLYQGLRGYARQIVQAQEEERERIARELHDETIQMLIVISRRLDLIAARPASLSEQDREVLRSAQDLLRDTQTGIRHFVQGLRPPTLAHLGLVPAIRGLVGDLRDKGIAVELERMGEPRRLTPGKELALYRITQEALNNVRQHAQATLVRVRLTFEQDRVEIVIQDDGCGFVAPSSWPALVSQGRLGLLGMDERARSQGGTVTHQSTPGHGTTVIVDLPI